MLVSSTPTHYIRMVAYRGRNTFYRPLVSLY
nr:MAG TPA: Protein trafficking PGA2 [Caudoviricetes sp.]